MQHGKRPKVSPTETTRHKALKISTQQNNTAQTHTQNLFTSAANQAEYRTQRFKQRNKSINTTLFNDKHSGVSQKANISHRGESKPLELSNLDSLARINEESQLHN